MAQLSNSPRTQTVIQLEARKSFSLGVHVYDPKGRNANLTDCSISLVAKPNPIDDDTDMPNILGMDGNAQIPVPDAGYAVFFVQAATLNVDPGEYPFAMVLRDKDGFSSVIVKGILDIQQNAEFASVGTTFSTVNPSLSLAVHLNTQTAINVYIGGQLPPGMNYVRDEIMSTIESFDPDDIAYMPTGGAPGYVLTKLNGDDFATTWRPIGNGQFSLDATGIPQGYAPVSQADDTWTWAPAAIDAGGVAIGFAPVSNGDGTWSWAQVTVATPDWNAVPGTDGEILNKPTLGTAASHDHDEYMLDTTLVSAMPGVIFQTTVPVTGTSGYIYLVYTP